LPSVTVDITANRPLVDQCPDTKIQIRDERIVWDKMKPPND